MKISWDWVVVGIILVLILGFALSSCAAYNQDGKWMMCSPGVKAKFVDGGEIDAKILPEDIILK